MLRHKIFLQKFEREKEIVDLSILPILPSCAANVEYRHIMRAEYVAMILRISRRLILQLRRQVLIMEMMFNNCSLTA